MVSQSRKQMYFNKILNLNPRYLLLIYPKFDANFMQ